MAYGDYGPEDYDYLLGTTKQAVENIQLQIADASSLSTSGGATTQIVGFDSGGNPIPINVQGDSNGAGLSVSSSVLTATLPQDLKTTGSPTFAGLTIGSGGTAVKKILYGTVSADPGSIAAQTRGSVDVTVTGAATGDMIIMNPPDGLNTGLAYVGSRITAGNTARIYLANITSGAIDDGSLTWDYLWYDLT